MAGRQGEKRIRPWILKPKSTEYWNKTQSVTDVWKGNPFGGFHTRITLQILVQRTNIKTSVRRMWHPLCRCITEAPYPQIKMASCRVGHFCAIPALCFHIVPDIRWNCSTHFPRAAQKLQSGEVIQGPSNLRFVSGAEPFQGAGSRYIYKWLFPIATPDINFIQLLWALPVPLLCYINWNIWIIFIQRPWAEQQAPGYIWTMSTQPNLSLTSRHS